MNEWGSIDHRCEDSGRAARRARLGRHGTHPVNLIPQHTRILIGRLLDSYCARICPPTARNTVLIGYRLEDDHAIIHELKRIHGVPGTCRPSPVARFRYRSLDNTWMLDYFDETPGAHAAWRRYRPLLGSRSFITLLREFDLDPAGYFWGRLDGKSLRWCSSKGRCIDCDVRYKQVLGLAEPIMASSTDTSTSVINARSTRR